MNKVKALALFSGGLDSILSVKIMLDQGIDVHAISFTTPFYLYGSKRRCIVDEMAHKLRIPLMKVAVGEDYIEIVRQPRYGYGRYMNPCIDCRIYMLRKASEYAKQIGARFIVTGEVLGERPMSQHRKAFSIIERETCLQGLILRPLSAKLLDETEAEREGLVDRGGLLDIKGRSRKRQMDLVAQYGIDSYPTPSGGCLLTYREFSAKLLDLFKHQEKVGFRDIQLLKVGRHFRFNESKIIVGRNADENRNLVALRRYDEYELEAVGCGSPITLLQSPITKDSLKLAARITARYSDSKKQQVKVRFKGSDGEGVLEVSPLCDETLKKFSIKWDKSLRDMGATPTRALNMD